MSQVANSATITWSEIGNYTYANVIQAAGGSQAWSQNLTDISALSPTANTMIVGNGVNFMSSTVQAAVSPSAAMMAIIFGG